jgi:hypothetical protein
MTNKPAYTNPDVVAIAVYNTAISFGMTKEQAQMILNATHDIAKNGQQTEIQLLSQFY